MRVIVDALIANASIVRLRLYANQLQSLQSIGHIVRLLENNHTLRDLDLGSSRINDAGFRLLVAALARNRSLIALGMARNQITDAGTNELVNLLQNKNNTTLININLPENRVTTDRIRLIDELLVNNQLMLHGVTPSNNSVLLETINHPQMPIAEKIRKVQDLINLGVDFNLVDINNLSILHHSLMRAAEANDLSLVELILITNRSTIKISEMNMTRAFEIIEQEPLFNVCRPQLRSLLLKYNEEQQLQPLSYDIYLPPGSVVYGIHALNNGCLAIRSPYQDHGDITLFDSQTRQFRHPSLSGQHQYDPYDCVELPDQTLLTCDHVGKIVQWDLTTATPPREYLPNATRLPTIRGLDVFHDKTHLAMVGGHTLRIVNLTNHNIHDFRINGTGICCLRSLPGNRLAVGLNDANNNLKLFNSEGGYIRTLNGHTAAIVSLTLHQPTSGNPILASISNDTTVRLWNFETGQCMHTLRHVVQNEGSTCAAGLAFLPGNILATGLAKLIYLWNLDNGEIIKIIDTGSELKGLTILSDGTLASLHEVINNKASLKLWSYSLLIKLIEERKALTTKLLDFEQSKLSAYLANYNLTPPAARSEQMHRQVDFLLEEVDGFSRRIWNTRENVIKYLGHIHHLRGEQFDDNANLERFNAKTALAMYMKILLAILVKLHNRQIIDADLPLHVFRNDLLRFVVEEIRGCALSYKALKLAEQNHVERLDDRIEELRINICGLVNLEDYNYETGYITHSFPINFLKFRGHIIIRADNLGEGSQVHLHQGREVKPFMIGCFPAILFTRRNRALLNYLGGIIQATFMAHDEALMRIYNTNDYYGLNNLRNRALEQSIEQFWQFMRLQDVGNCCVANRMVNRNYRALRIDPIRGDAMSSFLSNQEAEIIATAEVNSRHLIGQNHANAPVPNRRLNASQQVENNNTVGRQSLPSVVPALRQNLFLLSDLQDRPAPIGNNNGTANLSRRQQATRQ